MEESAAPNIRRARSNGFDLIVGDRSLLSEAERVSKLHEGGEDEVRVFFNFDLDA